MQDPMVSDEFLSELRGLAAEVEQGRQPKCRSSKEQPDRTPAELIPIVAQMKARGLTNTEIVSAVGVSPATLVQITTHPQFHRRLLDVLTSTAVDVSAYLRGEGLNSLVALAELRDDPATPRSVRASCANSLADRAFGKAVQRTEHRDAPPLPAGEEELDAELAVLAAETQRIKGN